MRIRKVVIPAAGRGTRLYPLTKAQPKEMLPVLDRPVIHYVVEEAVKSGLDEILIIVGKGKEAIINYFDKSELDSGAGDEYGIGRLPNIFFVRQKEQRGLADAVGYARDFVGDDPFMVMLGDTIYRTRATTVASQLIDVYNKEGSPVIGLEKVQRSLLSNYGVIKGHRKREGVWAVEDLVEKPEPEEAPSNLALVGMYLLDSNIFDLIGKVRPGKNGEYQLTDALRMLCKESTLLGREIDGVRYDIGSKESWVRTFIDFARKDPRFRRM